jgi:hypothetical protein
MRQSFLVLAKASAAPFDKAREIAFGALVPSDERCARLSRRGEAILQSADWTSPALSPERGFGRA